MPDVYSFGLGGGSLVRSENGDLRIGPDSVGFELTSKALVFGGNTLTTTDIAVANGLANIGDSAAVRSLDRHMVRKAVATIQEMTEIAVDRMKTSAKPIPVIVVGGGSILIGRAVRGASEMIKPPHFAVANAIGAAIAQVGGETDRIFSLDKIDREEALAQAREEASQKAIGAGANPATIQIVDVEEVPLTYLPSNATRIRIKAVGDLLMA
jgi:N-methylhydantoinase A/oxoprolinase/acetone carboxylase beta subunit